MVGGGGGVAEGGVSLFLDFNIPSTAQGHLRTVVVVVVVVVLGGGRGGVGGG